MMKPRLLIPAFSAAAFLMTVAPASAEDKAAPAPAPVAATNEITPPPSSAPVPASTPAPAASASDQKAAAVETPFGSTRKNQIEISFLGIGIVPLPESLTAQLKLKSGFGLLVTNVEGPAAQAGVAENDVLLMLDDQHLIEGSQFSVLVRSHKPGDEVTLTYVRGGEKKTVKLAVGKRVVDTGREARLTRPFSGMDSSRVIIQRNDPGASASDIRPRVPRGAGTNAYFEGDVRYIPTSRTIIRDGKLTYELQVENGKNVYVVREDGNERFRGSVDTEEERAKIPQEYRDSLKRMEAIRAKVTPPSIPLPPPPTGTPMSADFFEPQITADNLLMLDPSILLEDDEK